MKFVTRSLICKKLTSVYVAGQCQALPESMMTQMYDAFFHMVPLGHNMLSELFYLHLNTLRPRQNGRHFADDIFGCIFLNENVWIAIKIWLNFVPKGPINNIPTLVQIMAWRRTGDKPLSGPMMVSLPTHICVTRPQWVNPLRAKFFRGSINIFTIHFISFLHTDQTHVVKILFRVRQGHA